jgi:hypothetical protein
MAVASNRGERVVGIRYSARPAPGEHMPIFDVLPEPVREVLRNAPCDIDHIWVAHRMAKGADVNEVVSSIEDAIQAFIAALTKMERRA